MTEYIDLIYLHMKQVSDYSGNRWEENTPHALHSVTLPCSGFLYLIREATDGDFLGEATEFLGDERERFVDGVGI